jgi:GntR family transcriptional regulator
MLLAMFQVNPLSPYRACTQVADAIAIRIVSGQYAGRLPAERDLAAEFGVAYQTIRHAMAELRDRDLIIIRPGRGTFAARHRQRDDGSA